MQVLYIMQGVPGSGKTRLTYAIAACEDQLNNEVRVCSTDNFFMVNGKYDFQPELLGLHHAQNLAQARTVMASGRTAIVDNSNIHRWECREYVKFAVERGIPVVFIRVTGSFPNIHGVPEEVIQRMRAELEDLTVESVLASKTPEEEQAARRVKCRTPACTNETHGDPSCPLYCDSCDAVRPVCPLCGRSRGLHFTDCPVPPGYVDTGEGPFDTDESAREFAEAEVGLPWTVVARADKHYVLVHFDEGPSA